MEQQNVKTAFKVDDKYFDDIEEAKLYSNKLENQKTQLQKDLQHIVDIKENSRKLIRELYQKNNFDPNTCNCDTGRDYSDKCIKHLCTCNILKQFSDGKYDHYICDYHTNLAFRNTGCYWCRHRDCSKFFC